MTALDDARETVELVIVMLAGLDDMWNELDHAERCARAENELRHLHDRLEVA